MTVSLSKTAFVVKGGQSVALSQMVQITADSSNPAYLVLTGLDRNEYTASATDATGTLSGNGATDAFTQQSGDFRGIGIVFKYNAATGQYVNATYGNLAQLTYTTSASTNDLVNFGLFGLSSLALATQYASSPMAMMEVASSGYLGSASIATQPGFTATVPSQATPDSIAAVASSFIGDSWNIDGCWVLASTIATEAGAALPMVSTLVGVAGQASGEWIVAYNGPVSASSNWESLVHAGEMVSFAPGGTGGHIVTVTAGSGASAMVVDNAQYVNSRGATTNAANDGSANDITISAAHLFTQELSNVPASSVVIYELDTPVVTDSVATDTLVCKASQSLANLFTATDPANKTITQYQAYDTAAGDEFSTAGVVSDANSAATAVSAASLSAISYTAGSMAGADTIEVRAYNGSYWGDWTALGVTVSSAQAAPVLAHQTANQSWTAGQAVSLDLSASFTDPQGQALALSVTQANGSALPSTLHFNAATDMLTGTAPITAQTLGLKVTAADTGGLATSESFTASVAAAPVQTLTLALQTGPQSWSPGSKVSFALPSGTFTDAVTQHMLFAAYQTSGPIATSWLHFNAATETFSGTVPVSASGVIGLEVLARDGAGHFAIDSFSVALGTTTSHLAQTTGGLHYVQA